MKEMCLSQEVSPTGGSGLLHHPGGQQDLQRAGDQAGLLQHGQEVPPGDEQDAGRPANVLLDGGGLRGRVIHPGPRYPFFAEWTSLIL